MIHISVLLHESIEALDLQEGQTFLDGTLGGGGHSAEVLRRLPTVRIIGLDRDSRTVEEVEKRLKIETKVENFRNLDRVLTEFGLEKVDAILFDLGLSSDQIEDSKRGFSFLKNEPLDMRMSSTGITAGALLNSWNSETIELILRGFGEEPRARQIAEAIVKRRKVKPLETTNDLVEVVLDVKPRRWPNKIHPATKTFQALRIAVNEELTALEIGLEKGFRALQTKGRFAVISFHSLEDRIVKHFFRERVKEKAAQWVTHKFVRPSAVEIRANPRSRSAKLRVIEKNET